jgi:hypothetical protein
MLVQIGDRWVPIASDWIWALADELRGVTSGVEERWRGMRLKSLQKHCGPSCSYSIVVCKRSCTLDDNKSDYSIFSSAFVSTLCATMGLHATN